MKRALWAAGLFVAACGTSSTTVPSGQLTGPGGLAAVSAGDRDLVFIANSGRNGLVAFQLCTGVLADGGVDPNDSCTPDQDQQYVPGPIRVLTGTVETGDRTGRVAGARLTQTAPDGGTLNNGEVLAVGFDPDGADAGAAGPRTLFVVDAKVLVDAQERRVAADKANPVLDPIPLGAIGVDIATVNALDANDVETGSPSVRAFVATQDPPQVVALTASLDSAGRAQPPTIDGRCDLAGVEPRRIAVAPGRSDFAYVADGAGDGVVKVDTSSISAGGGPCSTQRIKAGGRSVISLALSPKWYETTAAGSTPTSTGHDSGELLIMVLKPLAAVTPGTQVDPGGILLARTSDGTILPLPGFDYRATGEPPMQPLIPLETGGNTALAREATFLRSLSCNSAPCTPLYLGTSSSGTTLGAVNFDLLAAVSSADGVTAFINVPKRHFVVPDAFTLGVAPAALNPSVASTTLTPAQVDPNAATITVDASPGVPGVARGSTWRVVWHGPMSGLERRGGSLTRTGPGTVRFSTSPANLNLWMADPVFHLGPGDGATVASATSPSAACKDLVSAFNAVSTASPEYVITAIASDGSSIDFQVPASGAPALTDTCPSIAVTMEIRTGGTEPWLVYQGDATVSRWHTGETYVARQIRYDYPFDACGAPGAPSSPACYQPNDPRTTDNTAFTFKITGNDPTTVSAFTISLSGASPTAVFDATITNGLANGILPYSSRRRSSLLFVSMAGSDEILQLTPSTLSSDVNGILAYR